MRNPYQQDIIYPTNPAPQGPQLQWLPEEQQPNVDLGGLAQALKRFKKPEGFGGGTPGGTDIGRAIKLPGFSGFGK